jgi:hypothetical protein
MRRAPRHAHAVDATDSGRDRQRRNRRAVATRDIAVGELLFDPWVAQLAARGVELRAGVRVAQLVPSASAKRIEALELSDGSRIEADEVLSN